MVNPVAATLFSGLVLIVIVLSGIRRSSISAVKRMHAILANSDGWTLKPASVSQRRAPLIGREKRTAMSPTRLPTERSIPPERITIVMPQARMP